MNNITKLLLALVCVLFLTTNAFAARQYGCTSLTGGAAGALDALDITGATAPNANNLENGDSAQVTTLSGTTANWYIYVFDSDGTTAESSPVTIRPDDYATAGVWRLVGYGTGGNMVSANYELADATIIKEAEINTLAEVNALIGDATLLDDGAIADSTATGLTAGDSYTNYGDAADDSLNELLEAIDTALGSATGLTDEASLYAALSDVALFYEPGDTIQTNSGTSLPGTCTVGETFIDTDADTNGSLYICIATNSWKEVDDDGGAGGGGDLLADGTVPLTANWDVGAYTITGTQFISDIATGTAPFVVSSTTEVANLHVATASTANAGDSATSFFSSGNIEVARLPTTGTWDASGLDLTLGALDGDIVFTEKADHASTPAAGYGYLWVKSDTPSSLMFTDDAGTDTELGAAGGATAWDDIGNPDADDTIDAAGYELTISSTLDEASHSVFTLRHTAASITNNISMLTIEANNDGDTEFAYLRLYDNAYGDNVFSIVENGDVITEGTIEAAGYNAPTPVVDAAADFAANFTGNDLYGGTFICDTAGTIQLPAVAEGYNFTIITKGAIAVVVEPNASDMMMLDGTDLDDADSATNTSTAGDIIVFQYMSAAGWIATSNGWTDED